MTGASKTVSSQDLLRNASLCYFVGWRNRSSQSRLKENSTGLKVSASMSSEPLLFLKHADDTRQNYQDLGGEAAIRLVGNPVISNCSAFY